MPCDGELTWEISAPRVLETRVRASSNFRELLVVGKALEFFKDQIRKREVQVFPDNTVAVSYLNHQGGTRSLRLLKLTQEILGEAERRIPPISVVHIRGTLNTHADFLSRQPIHQGEWERNSEVFSLVSQHFGRTEIDLFACRKNRKVQKFFSLAREQGSKGVDALAQSWRFGLAYTFPPLVLIPPGFTEVVSDMLLSDSNCTLVTKEGMVPHPKEVVDRPSVPSGNYDSQEGWWFTESDD